jgi:EAL domain-containing protein (putative c-di-GMP-specific phosphodiesterase class I)
MGIELFYRDSVKGTTFEASLRDAIVRGKLRAVFQPQVCLQCGADRGAEALVRWDHPVLGPVSPSDFIPLAEAYGLIGLIGTWMLGQCCELIAAGGGVVPRLAVNISPLEMIDSTLPRRLARLIREAGLDPRRLQLEISETAIIADPDRAVRSLGALRDIGVTLAIDDFSAGPDSLACLNRLPVEVLKLGRGVIADIDDDPVDRRIVRTIAALAQTLGMSVVAKGIERPSQIEMLIRCGIDVGQGFAIARPMPGAELLARITRDGHAPADRGCACPAASGAIGPCRGGGAVISPPRSLASAAHHVTGGNNEISAESYR